MTVTVGRMTDRFVPGVKFHPEGNADNESLRLFRKLVHVSICMPSYGITEPDCRRRAYHH